MCFWRTDSTASSPYGVPAAILHCTKASDSVHSAKVLRPFNLVLYFAKEVKYNADIKQIPLMERKVGRKMKKLLVAMLALVLVMSCFAGCGAKEAEGDSDLAYIQGKGTMIVGITEYEPMDYKDEDGNWIGFDADLANLVAEKLGVKAEFLVLADWGKKFYELDTKNIDVVWNGMTITEEAKLNTNVTVPYAMNAQVVVMNMDKAADYADPDSLKGLNFAVESGSAGEAALMDMGFTDLVAVQDQPAAIMEVAAGTADACVIDLTMANAMTGPGTSYTQLEIAQSLNEEQYGIGFRKGSDVTAKVNEILAEFKADGTLDKLSQTYGIVVAD